jgi:hypothetical protein
MSYGLTSASFFTLSHKINKCKQAIVRKKRYHRNEELKSHPQVSSMTKVWLRCLLNKMVQPIRNSRVSKSEAEKRDLDLLQVWFLEDLSLGVDGMHERTPKRVKKLRLSPYLLH